MDSFLNYANFIKLAHSIYFGTEYPLTNSPNDYNRRSNNQILTADKFQNDLFNLLNITKLSTQTLVHSLYYLYLLVNHRQSLFNDTANDNNSSATTTPIRLKSFSRTRIISSVDKKNHLELFNLMVVLLMISNKTNDDSSYTLKTWTNLTELTSAFIIKKEVVILKKINYNAFLKPQQFNSFCLKLIEICYKFNILIKDDDLLISPLILPSLTSFTSLASTENDNNNNTNTEITPISPISPLLELYPDQTSQHFSNDGSNNKRSYYNWETDILVDDSNKKHKPHPINCHCCMLTNLTNLLNEKQINI